MKSMTHLGKFLIESAPKIGDLELPPRADSRGDPFAGVRMSRRRLRAIAELGFSLKPLCDRSQTRRGD
jgi:hypothetical protein